MRLSPLLLRLLLIVALIANGSASAFAATRMQVEHFGAEIAVAEAGQSHAGAVAPPCHEDPVMAIPSVDTMAASTDGTGEPSDSGHGSPDCCKSAKCQCACMHHAAATVASVHFLGTRIEHASSVRALSTGHAAPALPHLIRPPIG